MSLKKRLAAVLVVAIAAGLTFGIAKSGREITEKQEEIVFSPEKETIYLWYTDEILTSFLSSVAVSYNETHDVRVVPVLESGPEYLEKINQATIAGEGPDLYIIGNDSLEKAYLAGLAEEVEPSGTEAMKDEYIGTGLLAATYKDKIIGYPFYFETSALIYNKTYLQDMAVTRMQAEEVQAAEDAGLLTNEAIEEAEQAKEASADTAKETVAEPAYTQEQITQKMQEILPFNMEEMKTFADSYDAPAQVEGVFKWDVTDIFYNYFFVGNAISVGGEAGWDPEQIDIYNQNSIESMKVYQEMNQFFSIETAQSDYESILDEFINGKMVFTVATTDAVFKLEDAKADGLFDYEYGVTTLPDINEELGTRPLSVTSCVVVNGYALDHRQAANDFAHYLTVQNADQLYGRTSKVSAAANVDYGYEALSVFEKEYEKSISMPKMLETSNFWVKLEAAFSEIWNGADANEKLRTLSEEIMTQVTGEDYQESYLEETAAKQEETEEEQQQDASSEEQAEASEEEAFD